MKASEKTNSIYAQLRRYVDESVQKNNYVGGRYLHSIVQKIELNNQKLTFVISPARIRDENGDEKYYHQTPDMKFLEEALFRLTKENPNFESEKNTLYCSLSEIINELNLLNSPCELKNPRNLQQNIRILADIKFELKNNESGAELCFRAIEKLGFQEENEEIYYQMRFSPLFINKTEIFHFIFPSKI